MPVPPPNPSMFYPYKFEVGDIVRVLPSAGKWADLSRDYSECEIIQKYMPGNRYGPTEEPMAAYNLKSLVDGEPGTVWEVDIELIRKPEGPRPKQKQYRSIDDD